MREIIMGGRGGGGTSGLALLYSLIIEYQWCILISVRQDASYFTYAMITAPLPQYKDAPLPEYKDTPLPRYKDAPLPWYKDAQLPEYKEAPLPRYEDAPLPRYEDAPLPPYKDNLL